MARHMGHHAKFEKKKACRIDGEGVMMLYPLYRAAQKLWLNRKTYLFLLMEFVLGTTVVLCGYLSG